MARDRRTGPPPPEPAPEPATEPEQEPKPEPAHGYPVGTAERWQERVAVRAADLALSAMPVPLRVLDVGCGSGALLHEMVVRVPYGTAYVGIDPSPDAIAAARRDSDVRIMLLRAAAEGLPFADASFDLVISTSSFGLWRDQRAGVEELARVVTENGRVVLVDRGQSKGAARLLARAGLTVEGREVVHRRGFVFPLVRAFVAAR